MKKNDKTTKRGRKTRYPGVMDVGKGMYRVRGKATCPRTGRTKEFDRVVEAENVQAAAASRLYIQRTLLEEVDGADVPATLGEYAARWLAKRLGDRRSDGRSALAPSTRERYRRSVEDVIVPQIGTFRLDLVRQRDFELWRDELRKRYRAATVNSHLRVLRVMLNDSGSERLAAIRIRCLPEDDGRISEDDPNLLDQDELARFLEVAQREEPGHYPLILLMVTTGLRIGTALALRREDFLPDKGIVIARRRLSGSEVLEGVKRSRRAVDRVPLLPEVWTVLQAQWAEHTERQVASGLAFPSRSGRHHAKSILRKPVMRIAAEAGIDKRLTPHGFRRTAVDMYRRTSSSVVSKAIAGHLTEGMHAHYSRVDEKEKLEAATKAFGHLRLVDDPTEFGGGEAGGEFSGEEGQKRRKPAGLAS